MVGRVRQVDITFTLMTDRNGSFDSAPEPAELLGIAAGQRATRTPSKGAGGRRSAPPRLTAPSMMASATSTASSHGGGASCS